MVSACGVPRSDRRVVSTAAQTPELAGRPRAASGVSKANRRSADDAATDIRHHPGRGRPRADAPLLCRRLRLGAGVRERGDPVLPDERADAGALAAAIAG